MPSSNMLISRASLSIHNMQLLRRGKHDIQVFCANSLHDVSMPSATEHEQFLEKPVGVMWNVLGPSSRLLCFKSIRAIRIDKADCSELGTLPKYRHDYGNMWMCVFVFFICCKGSKRRDRFDVFILGVSHKLIQTRSMKSTQLTGKMELLVDNLPVHPLLQLTAHIACNYNRRTHQFNHQPIHAAPPLYIPVIKSNTRLIGHAHAMSHNRWPIWRNVFVRLDVWALSIGSIETCGFADERFCQIRSNN